MKKILLVSAVFPPEMVTSALMNYDLAVELAKEYDVTVLRPFPTRPLGVKFDSTDVENDSFKTILINSYTHPQSEFFGRFRESNDFGNKSVEYIENHHNDIDFIYNDGWQLFSLYKVVKVAKKYGIPYMVPIQDIYPECLFTNKKFPKIVSSIITRLLLSVDKYYLKNATSVRTISKEMADYLSSTRKINRDKFLVVNNWQNDEDFLIDYPKRKNDGRIIFGYVGSINSHANVELIIKAFSKANIENSELRIYGGGNKKDSCLDLVKSLGSSNIKLDMVSRKDVAYVQSQVDVLILALPAGNGNLCLPSKMTSYMLSGKAILASVDSDSATARYIRDAKCGLSVAPDDIETLKDGFSSFSRMSKSVIEELGENALSYSTKHLKRSVCITAVINEIKHIIK